MVDFWGHIERRATLAPGNPAASQDLGIALVDPWAAA